MTRWNRRRKNRIRHEALEIVDSPLCEANAAFVGKLQAWLAGSDICLTIVPYETYAKANGLCENRSYCFIDVRKGGALLDSVPLHRDRLCEALGITAAPEPPACGSSSPITTPSSRAYARCASI